MSRRLAERTAFAAGGDAPNALLMKQRHSENYLQKLFSNNFP